MKTTPELPIHLFASQRAWEAWLARHYGDPAGLWLQIAKKDSGAASVSYLEAVESALCYGWIDGQMRSLDERFYLQKFTPRRERSIWSKVNRAKAEALINAGRMQPAGLAEIEQARADGRWEAAYDSPATATIPADFERALGENAKANAFFATLNSANRYAILFRIQTAKRPEARRNQIEKLINMLEAGEKLHP